MTKNKRDQIWETCKDSEAVKHNTKETLAQWCLELCEDIYELQPSISFMSTCLEGANEDVRVLKEKLDRSIKILKNLTERYMVNNCNEYIRECETLLRELK